MTFLFSPGRSQEVSVSTYLDSDGTEEALLTQEIWDTLKKTGERTAVSITSPYTYNHLGPIVEMKAEPPLKTLVCWTRPSATISGLGIPSQWLYHYPELFSGVNDHPTSIQCSTSTHSVTPTLPVALAQVFLVAESKRSYDYSVHNQAKLCTQICSSSKFIRQSSIISIPLEESDINLGETGPGRPSSDLQIARFRVAMTEPTLQGIAVQEYTHFVVIPGPEDTDEQDVGFTDDASSLGSGTSTELLSDSDIDDLVIGEGFLANGVISSVPRSPASNIPNGKSSHLNGEEYSPAQSAINFRRAESVSSSIVVQVQGLHLPISVLCTQKYQIDDSENCIFLKSADLSRVGLFNGDWGVVANEQQSNPRLCRIFAKGDKISRLSGAASASPVLLENINSIQRFSTTSTVSIRSSVFGSRSPPIPVARSVTVARVASPFSNGRLYQPFFLHALKEYFDGRKRLVKKGDLIAVPLMPEIAQLAKALENEEMQASEKQENDNADNNSDLIASSLPVPSKSHGTVAVFFKVTNIEYDVVDIAEDVELLDHYAAATMGELGCWIHTQVTKVVQTGVENSWIPDVGAYLNLGIKRFDVSLGFNTKEPLRKLWDLSIVTLQSAALDYGLQLSILLKGSRGTGKFTAISQVARSLGLHLLEINCFDLVGENDIQTEGTLRARFEGAAACAPCILALRHIEALARTTQVLETGKEPSIASSLQECVSDLSQTWKSTGYPVLVMATTSEFERVPASLLASFKHEIVFEAPSESERLDILRELFNGTALAPDVSLQSIATQTAAMVASDLVNLVELARSAAFKRAMSYSYSGYLITEKDLFQAGLMLTANDLDIALSAARVSFSESIGAPKIPNVSWDDVGGLMKVKSDILDTIQLPLEHPELFVDGLKKRSGILLYGPPGTGKTLLAKAVATSCSLNFFSVKGPELLNMYIGESEANVRRVFQRARDAKPCVIFFDELDSVAPKRGNHGDSGGVMDRIVSQLLAELDGMADGKSGADVFVIGATNRPDLLDPALLRPGRFDRMLYLGVSDTHEAQYNILQALTRRFRCDPGLDLRDIAQQCPFNYTGADFYALCSDAMLKAMSRKAAEVDTRITELNARPSPYEHPHPITPQYYLAEMASPSETEVLVSRQDFEQALKELVPSVSREEMAHYAAVQRRFTNETINSQVATQEDVASVGKGKGKGKAIEA